MQKDDLSAKLAEIGDRIEQAKKKMEHHGIFAADHQVTQNELNVRFKELETELNEDVTSLEKHHKHIGELEDRLLNWMNSVDFDFS